MHLTDHRLFQVYYAGLSFCDNDDYEWIPVKVIPGDQDSCYSLREGPELTISQCVVSAFDDALHSRPRSSYFLALARTELPAVWWSKYQPHEYTPAVTSCSNSKITVHNTTLELHRTLRVPDDDTEYLLPPVGNERLVHHCSSR